MVVQLVPSHCLVRGREFPPALELGLRVEDAFPVHTAAAPQQRDQVPPSGKVGHSMSATYWVEPLVGGGKYSLFSFT